MTSYQGLVLQGFQALREEGLLCDFTLLTEGSQFNVHKALLASVSIYFQAVFRSGMMEVQENKMEMKGVSATGLRGVLHFMYTGKLRLNQEIVMDVFRAANHLQLDSVINACVGYLIKSLTTDNVKDMQSLADSFNLVLLKDAINTFITKKFSKFARTNYFKQLPLSEICKILKDDSLSCSSEFKLMKIVLDWINYNRESREPLIGNLMKNIRLACMSFEELQYLAKVTYIRKNRHCLALIEKAVYFLTHPNEQLTLVSPSTEIRSNSQVVAFSCSADRCLSTKILYKNQWCDLDKAIAQPRPFVNAAAAVCNNLLYVCGGQGISEATSSCLCFNPYTCKWTTIPPMTRPRRNLALVSHDLCLYAICGISRNYEVTNEVEKYSIKQNKWVPSFCTESKMADMAACALSGKIYIAGGVDENCFHSTDFTIFDTASEVPKPGPGIPEIKFKPSMFPIKDRLYLMDLYRTEGTTSTLDQYDPYMQQWTRVPLPNVHFSRGFSAVSIDNWIYFVGRNDVEDGSSKRYNIETGVTEDIKAFPCHIESPLCVALKLPTSFTRRSLQNIVDAS